MSVLEVRDFKPDDAAEVSRVHADTWQNTYLGQVSDGDGHDGIARATARDWTGHADLRVALGGGVLVLVRDGAVVGFCEFGPTEDGDDDALRVGHIMRLYVHPTCQGRQGGRLLLECACGRLADSGYDNVTLWTLDADSNRAHGFYRHLGWAREDVHRADDPDDIRYRRPLPPPSREPAQR